ncbi:MAG: hypothetical protein JW819_11500 [Candidatus Krumholzibacteriota bacterium]|nr:hypothetical protein [Candidatus Krumholzibacteriota bacterium]
MRIRDDVASRSREDYRAAAAREAERLGGDPAVEAVLVTGVTSAPGVSDLDLVLVLAADARPAPGTRRALLRPVDPYLSMHPPFAVSRDALTDLRWLLDLERLEVLSGSLPEIPAPPADARPLLAAIAVLETGLHKLAALRASLLAPVASARGLLISLHSLGHSLGLAASLAPEGRGADAAAADWRERVAALRAGWLRLPAAARTAAVRELLDAAPPLLEGAFMSATDFLAARAATAPPARARGEVRVDAGMRIAIDADREDWRLPDPWLSAAAAKRPAPLRIDAPAAAGIPFAYLRATLPPGRRAGRLAQRIRLDEALAAWCLRQRGAASAQLLRRFDALQEHLAWHAPLRGLCFPLYPYAEWITGRLGLGVRLALRAERALARAVSS